MATKTKYQELADAEEAKLEAEPDTDEGETEPAAEDDDAADEDADEDAAEPEAVAEPLSLEAMQRRLEAEATRHAEVLASVFGDTFSAYDECPMCFMLGFVAPESPMLDPTTQRCERCRGYGVLVTEAVVEKHRTRQCPGCMGNGYVPRIEVQAAEAAPMPVLIPAMPVYNPVTNQWEVPPATPAPGYVPPGVAASSTP